MSKNGWHKSPPPTYPTKDAFAAPVARGLGQPLAGGDIRHRDEPGFVEWVRTQEGQRLLTQATLSRWPLVRTGP
jgi:hypothetical protein